MTQEVNNPWDEARAISASHSELYNAREKAKTKEEQNFLAKYEHRAFTREAVKESPVPIGAAIGLAAAIPAYQAKKVLGIGTPSRSDPSIGQAVEAYKGVAEGMAAVVKAPWIEAQEAAKSAIDYVAKAVSPKEQKPVPWEVVPIKKEQPQFEKVFAKLIQAESRGKHRDASGNLTSSPVGAKGITQVMHKTGEDPGYGVKPLQDDSEAEYKRFGKDYLKAMLKEFDDDYEKALAAYNAGAANVKKAIKKGGENWKDHLPKKSETLPYIEKILGKKNG